MFLFFFFFFNDTATTEIYTLSLHDALPIYLQYGRDKLFAVPDLARISELIRYITERGLRCRSTSVRRARANRRTMKSEGPTSESKLKKALRRALRNSRSNSSARSERTSNVVRLPGRASPPSARRPSDT